LKINIAAERCTGHGRCYNIAPMLFSDDERGFGEVIGEGQVASEHEERARAAVVGCPEHAVVLES
jgi:ferredoxin